MAMTTVFTVPGIGEQVSPVPAGLLANLTQYLPRGRYELSQFNYRNQYGPVGGGGATSYGENLADAVLKLAAAVRAVPRNTVVLVGYSAGAQVVSMLLEEIAAGKHRDLVIAGAVLVANPVRHRNDSPAPGWGVAGEHKPFPRNMWVIDVANPEDIICCSEQFSPIRLFADTSRYFSTRDPMGWIGQYAAQLTRGAAQAWWNPAVRGRYSRAADGLRKYADGSAHALWYIRSGSLQRAAQSIVDRT